MPYQLNHIHVLCSDLEKMIRFFTENLEASLVERKKFGGADGASLNLQGTIINLRIAQKGEKINEDTSRSFYGFHHIGLTVENIEDAYKELTGKGFDFFIPITDTGKSKIAFFKGPDSITIELLQPLEQ